MRQPTDSISHPITRAVVQPLPSRSFPGLFRKNERIMVGEGGIRDRHDPSCRIIGQGALVWRVCIIQRDRWMLGNLIIDEI